MTTQHQHKARTKSSSSLNSNFFKKVGIYFKFLFFYVLNKKVVQIMFPIAMLVAIIIGLLPLVLFNETYNATKSMSITGPIASFIVSFVLGINLGRYTFGDSRNQGTEILILSKPITRYQILVGRFLFLFIFCLVIGIILSVFNTIFLLLADTKVKNYFPNEYDTSNLKNFINITWISLGICIFGGLLSGFIAVFRNGKILPVLAPLIFFLILIIGLFYPLIVNGMNGGGSDAITNLYKEESDNKIKPTTEGLGSTTTDNAPSLKAFRGSYDPFSKSKSNLSKNAYYQLSDSLNSDVYKKAFSNLTNSASNQAARFFNYINPLGLFIPNIFSFTLDTQNISLDQIQKYERDTQGKYGYYTYDYNYDKNSNNYFPTVKSSVDNSPYLIVPSQQKNHYIYDYVYLPNNYGIFVEESLDIPVSLEYHVKASDGSNFSKIFASSTPTAPPTTDDYYFSANFLFSRILQTLTNALLVSDDIQNALINYFASFGNDQKSISFTDFSSDASKAISDSKDNVLNELKKLKTLKAPDDITNWLNEFFSPLINQIENNSQSSYSSSNSFTESFGGLSIKQKLLSEISSISELINAITPSNFVLLISGYASLYFSIFTSYHNIASSITDLSNGANQGLTLNLSYSTDGTTQKTYDDKSLALPESLILGAYPKTESSTNYYWWANSDYGSNFNTKTPVLDPSTPSSSSKDPLFSLLGFVGNGTNPLATDPTASSSYGSSGNDLIGKTYMDALQNKALWNTSPIEYAPNNQLDKNFWMQDFMSYRNHNLETPYTPFLLLPSSQVFILTEVNRSPTWAIALLWTLVSLALIPAICVVFLRRDYLEVNN